MVHKLNSVKKNSTIYIPSFFENWKSFVKRTGKPTRVYGIKLDIKDAFGNVKLPLLCDIIKNHETDVLTSDDRDYIIQRILNQYVAFGGKKKCIYKWKHGLLQGDRLSTGLHELYMNHFEKIHILPIYNKGLSFLHRTVDDYIFCSTNKQSVQHFESAVKNLFIVNDEKTCTNIRYPGGNHLIPFCGLIINLDTKEISKSYAFEKNYQIRYKFKLWNIYKPIPLSHVQNFIKQTIPYSRNNNYFQRTQINTDFNSEEVVLYNFYSAMCFLALKVDVAINAVKGYVKEQDIFGIISRVIVDYSKIILSKINKSKGALYRGNIHFRLLQFVAAKAFIAVLKKRSFNTFQFVIRNLQDNFIVRVSAGDLKIKFGLFNKLPSEFMKLCFHRPVRI